MQHSHHFSKSASAYTGNSGNISNAGATLNFITSGAPAVDPMIHLAADFSRLSTEATVPRSNISPPRIHHRSDESRHRRTYQRSERSNHSHRSERPTHSHRSEHSVRPSEDTRSSDSNGPSRCPETHRTNAKVAKDTKERRKTGAKEPKEPKESKESKESKASKSSKGSKGSKGAQNTETKGADKPKKPKRGRKFVERDEEAAVWAGSDDDWSAQNGESNSDMDIAEEYESSSDEE